jgi:hypothetical protein
MMYRLVMTRYAGTTHLDSSASDLISPIPVPVVK